jgi:hypothetical protein
VLSCWLYEAQIEVRVETHMANMRKTDEMLETVNLMGGEVINTDIVKLRRGNVN